MSSVPKTGGAEAQVEGGNVVDQAMLDPNKWLISTFRSLKSYMLNNTDADLYEIIFSFPSDKDLDNYMPLSRTLVHFEIDEIVNTVFGFGDNVIDSVEDNAGNITEYEVRCHDINFEVGVWTSAKSGGTTQRLLAAQFLHDLFHGASARETLLTQTGLDIRSFTGGMFIKEEVNQLDIYRVSGMTLVLRVYSRHTNASIALISNPTIINSLLTFNDQVVINLP